jgi:hypothetical protein
VPRIMGLPLMTFGLITILSNNSVSII